MKKLFKSALMVMSMLAMVVSVSSCGDDDDDNKGGKGANPVAGRTFVYYEGDEARHQAVELEKDDNVIIMDEYDYDGSMEISIVEFAADGTYTTYFADCYYDLSENEYVQESDETKGTYEVKGKDVVVYYTSPTKDGEEEVNQEILHIKESGKQVILWNSEMTIESSSKDAYELLKEFNAKHEHK